MTAWIMWLLGFTALGVGVILVVSAAGLLPQGNGAGFIGLGVGLLAIAGAFVMAFRE